MKKLILSILVITYPYVRIDRTQINVYEITPTKRPLTITEILGEGYKEIRKERSELIRDPSEVPYYLRKSVLNLFNFEY